MLRWAVDNDLRCGYSCFIMSKRAFGIGASVLAAAVLQWSVVHALDTGAAVISAADRAEVARANAQAVKAAAAFLATLSESERAAVLFEYSDEAQRARWSNLPTPLFKRKGLKVGDLQPAQRKAAMAVLEAATSPMGYRKTMEIVTAEEVLKQGGGIPSNLIFGEDEFYLSFVGKPSEKTPWLLQFGGHHLALNLTFGVDQAVLTPSHTAAQPAKYTLNGKTIRPLGAENDKAFDLINALDAVQREAAILGSVFRDVILGPGQDGKKLAPEGVKVSTFNPAQKALLMGVVREWVGMTSEAAAKVKMAEVEANLGETWFAWSGPTTPGSAAYFRIQGPTVHIEYAPQNLGGSPVNHIHTIFRDPTNDYGRKFAKP